LHSIDPAKDARAFAEALAVHRERHGDRFSRFVFPGTASFREATFSEDVDFRKTTFSKDADFTGATFSKDANFSEATFSEVANFGMTTFSKGADFTGATFSKDAVFSGAKFSKGVIFGGVKFSESALFIAATFSKSANFMGATFSEGAYFCMAAFNEGGTFWAAIFGKEALFTLARFSGITLFAGQPPSINHIFAGTVVDFRQVVINPPDVITFLGADLTTCEFLDTDLRKVQLANVEWPKKRGRVLIYDEIAPLRIGDEDRRPWFEIERLYRELKQNYEDRRDYERAGDFHYGEKQMRRQNPDTARGLRFFLTLYWLFSGYGERYLKPLVWAGLLFVGSTIGYWWWGLCPKAGGAKLAWANWRDWLQGVDYSIRVMTLLKPDDWDPVGYARYVRTFQTLLGPLFLGLFALALRQRLKR
jgi:uncharacterized protein YjbI with pentapeptide repeats